MGQFVADKRLLHKWNNSHYPNMNWSFYFLCCSVVYYHTHKRALKAFVSLLFFTTKTNCGNLVNFELNPRFPGSLSTTKPTRRMREWRLSSERRKCFEIEQQHILLLYCSISFIIGRNWRGLNWRFVTQQNDLKKQYYHTNEIYSAQTEILFITSRCCYFVL